MSLALSTLLFEWRRYMAAVMALALSKYRFKGNGLVDIFLVLPLTTPEIVLGAFRF